MSKTLELAIELISRPSITPEDKGCQTIIAERLSQLGFNNEHLRSGEVDNLWSRRGQAKPLFVFAGHTDVVPTGNPETWQFPPFTPTQHEGYLYGRGAVDMKSSIAAMITACERFIERYPTHQGSIAFLITSDEEGPATDGTIKVIKHLEARHEKMDWCLVGEPSSAKKLGDEVKNGRRGSITGHLTVHGVQGHVAYPHLADNPIHKFSKALAALCQTEWDQGNAFFPPTTFQVSNIHAGTGANNVIPQELGVVFNFRYSTELTHHDIEQKMTTLLDSHHLNYTLHWEHSGEPFLTSEGELIAATQAAIKEICHYDTKLSTSGGTSDGRMIAPTGAQVVELGLLNATIHKVNECVSINDLDLLSDIYERILEKLLLD